MVDKPIYPCLIVTASKNISEEITNELEEFGPVAIEERDDKTFVGPEEGEIELVVGFADSNSRDLAAHGLLKRTDWPISIQALDLSGNDWLNGWKDYFKPVVLKKIQIVAPWMEPPHKDRLSVIVDPGQAFGTGGHGSTVGVLKLLEKQALRKEGLPERVLDVGTGSGVLAIAAAILGAAAVTAIDIDEEAVNATINNCRVNNVVDVVKPILKTAGELEEEWPLVLANLELPIFREHGAEIVQRVQTSGTLYAGGLLVDQVDEFLSLFEGFELVDQLDEEGWAGLSIRRAQ